MLSVSAFAADDTKTAASSSSDTMTAETEVDGNNITVNVVMPDTSADADTAATKSVAEDTQASASSVVTYSLDDAASAAGDSMSQVVTSLFGTYSPKTQTVTEHLSDGTSVSYQQYVPGVAGLDWNWLTGVMLFSLCLWSFFRLVGGVLKRG